MKNLQTLSLSVLFAWVLLGSLILIYFQNIDGVFLNKPLTFNTNEQALVTDKTVYRPGDTIRIKNSVCRNRDYIAHTTWRLYNETVITFPDQGTKLGGKGCVTDKWFEVGKVPPYAIEGVHHLEATSAVTVSKFKTIYYYFRSVDFYVE